MRRGHSSIRHIITAAMGALISFLFIAEASPALGAEISAEPVKPGSDREFISLVGDITESDVQTFRRIALTHDSAVVWLASNGGEMYPAIEIGRIIRLKGFDTYVSNSSPCNSACALIFVSGAHRYLAKSATVGFHATYLDKNGKKEESGVGNAVIGSYFAQLNLSEPAVIFATTAPPDRINALTISNSEEVGISVSPLDDVEENKDSNKSEIQPTYSHVGAWAIGIDRTVGDGCFILGSWPGGVAFRLGIDRRQPHPRHYLVAFGQNWKSIEDDKNYEISLKLDENAPWAMSGNGGHLDEAKGIFVFFEDNKFMNEMYHANTVQIIYKGRVIEHLSMPNISAALDEMNKCQSQQIPHAEDPFAN